MAKTMKAAVLRALRTPLAIEDLPVPAPGPGELLVRVTACGVCHSDVHAVDGDWDPPPVLPLDPRSRGDGDRGGTRRRRP